MLPGHNVKTNIGVLLGLIAGAVIYYEPWGALPPVYNYVIVGLGLGCQAWGCYNYVTGKGQSPILTLIGVAPLALFLSGVIPDYHAPAYSVVLIPIGLLILVLLPDDTVDRRQAWRSELATNRNAEKESNASGMGGVIVIVVMLALAIGSWYYSRRNLPVTEQEARKQAVERYPALAVRDSPLNREFIARYNRLQATEQDYFKDPQWPLKLAAESQAAVDQAQAKR
jgi:hypothetical protein